LEHLTCPVRRPAIGSLALAVGNWRMSQWLQSATTHKSKVRRTIICISLLYINRFGPPFDPPKEYFDKDPRHFSKSEIVPGKQSECGKESFTDRQKWLDPAGCCPQKSHALT
jgi:hypothetical protein